MSMTMVWMDAVKAAAKVIHPVLTKSQQMIVALGEECGPSMSMDDAEMYIWYILALSQGKIPYATRSASEFALRSLPAIAEALELAVGPNYVPDGPITWSDELVADISLFLQRRGYLQETATD